MCSKIVTPADRRAKYLEGALPFAQYAAQIQAKPQAQTRRGIEAQEYALPRPYHVRRPGMHEDVVLKSTMALLSKLKLWHRRIQVQGVFQRTGTGEAVLRPSSMTGMPDLIALVGGEFWGIECKAPGGKVSSLQLATLKEIEAVGGIGVILVSENALEQVFAGSEPSGYVEGIGVW